MIVTHYNIVCSLENILAHFSNPWWVMTHHAANGPPIVQPTFSMAFPRRSWAEAYPGTKVINKELKDLSPSLSLPGAQQGPRQKKSPFQKLDTVQDKWTYQTLPNHAVDDSRVAIKGISFLVNLYHLSVSIFPRIALTGSHQSPWSESFHQNHFLGIEERWICFMTRHQISSVLWMWNSISFMTGTVPPDLCQFYTNVTFSNGTRAFLKFSKNFRPPLPLGAWSINFSLEAFLET